MWQQTINQPMYGPLGEPYTVTVKDRAGAVMAQAWFWTAAEAWDARDRALDAGLSYVRVDGVPTVQAGV